MNGEMEFSRGLSSFLVHLMNLSLHFTRKNIFSDSLKFEYDVDVIIDDDRDFVCHARQACFSRSRACKVVVVADISSCTLTDRERKKWKDNSPHSWHLMNAAVFRVCLTARPLETKRRTGCRSMRTLWICCWDCAIGCCFCYRLHL